MILNICIWLTPLGYFIGLLLYKVFFNGYKMEIEIEE